MSTPAGAVTIPRTLVQTVVTEHGAADLRGLTVRERARALVAIADPGHREGLLKRLLPDSSPHPNPPPPGAMPLH